MSKSPSAAPPVAHTAGPVYAKPGVMANQERSESCGCKYGAEYTTEGLSVHAIRCKLHASAPDLARRVEELEEGVERWKGLLRAIADDVDPDDYKLKSVARARHALLQADHAEARRVLAKGVRRPLNPNRFDCTECGEGVAVDEDGCCVTCGRVAKVRP